MTAQLEKAKFFLSSRPQTVIRSPPISGPRPSFLARFRCGSRPPASAGPIPVRTLSGSRAAAEHSDPELRSFRWILRDGDTYKIEVFSFPICFARGETMFIVPPLLPLFFLLLLRSSSRTRGLPLSLDTLPARVAFGIFHPLCLACGAPYSVVPAELYKLFDGPILFAPCLFRSFLHPAYSDPFCTLLIWYQGI